MLIGKKVCVIMPAYNAARTLKQTYDELPHDIVDFVILTDDCSRDNTVQVANDLNIVTVRHETNRGYGGNQKTCYAKALSMGADIVIMIHPDYQYTPKLARGMVSLIAEGLYDVVLGSRILGTGALAGGMPLYKYIANRFLTFAENLLTGQKLSEYHTGYRAFSKEVLENLKLEANSDDFIFDNQMLVQSIVAGYQIAEITCPTKYFDEASSINFQRSSRYGLLCLWTGWKCLLHRKGVATFNEFIPKNKLSPRSELASLVPEQPKSR